VEPTELIKRCHNQADKGLRKVRYSFRARTHTHTHTYIYTYIYICMYTYIYIYIYNSLKLLIILLISFDHIVYVSSEAISFQSLATEKLQNRFDLDADASFQNFAQKFIFLAVKIQFIW
jgi:hypothetical protein